MLRNVQLQMNQKKKANKEKIENLEQDAQLKCGIQK